MEPVYLGDGAYATPTPDPMQIRIFTTDGISSTNEVFLEAEGLVALVKFARERMLWRV